MCVCVRLGLLVKEAAGELGAPLERGTRGDFRVPSFDSETAWRLGGSGAGVFGEGGNDDVVVDGTLGGTRAMGGILTKVRLDVQC